MNMKMVSLAAIATVACPAFAVQPVFRASFEGTTDAICRGKAVRAARAEGVTFEAGPAGQSVRFSSAAKSAVEYAVRQVVGLREGAVAFWMRADFAKDRRTGADVFFTRPFDASRPSAAVPAGVPTCPSASGTGAVRVWMSTPAAWLRGECYDDKQSHTGQMAETGVWHHYTFVWDGASVTMYVDGRGGLWSDGASPMREAIERANPKSRYFTAHTYAQPKPTEGFVLGAPAACGPDWGFDGALDELAVFDRRLTPDEVAAFAASCGVRRLPSVDWTAKFAGKSNPFVGLAGGKLDLELVEEVRLDSEERIAALRASERLAHCGPVTLKSLGGVRYAEIGGKPGDRIALRFPGGKATHPLDFFEVEYPDDAFRTCDMIIQGTKGGGEYSMQVGYACGHEYANSGRMQVFRTPYWMPSNGTDDLTLIATTARAGQPAAIAAVRRYRVRDGRLPPVAFNLPPKVNGWNRSFALFYEDPSINYDFGAKDDGFTEEGLLKLADACVATMKYAGQDLLAYPGVWYQGLIEADGYNPRHHAPNFLDGFYARFDAAGLGVIPTLNPNSMPVPDGLVTLASMTNGSLHSSPISITATGKPNWGGWHNTPPNFNIAHPEVQKRILGWVDALLAQGVRHPSFRGICLHLTRHCFLSWGVADGGYNDYAIEAFERFARMKVPVDRADPLRGMAYAVWLKANAWDEWCAYRKSVVNELCAEIAARVRKARPDLRLWINSFNMGLQTDSAYLKENATDLALRDMGVKGCDIEAAVDRRLGTAGEGLIVAQTFLPCKPRWATRSYKDGDPIYEKMKRIHLEKDTFSILDRTSFPWIGQHDIYWESACDRRNTEGRLLNGAWLSECSWRVVTINPSGRNQLEAFAAPLRHSDALGISKGGFLVGTYGMEDAIRPFVQAFKALPAVKFDTLVAGDVTVRQRRFDGRSWFYAVNTTGERRQVRLEIPSVATDLVSGERLGKGSCAIALEPWELKSYVMSEGKVVCKP